MEYQDFEKHIHYQLSGHEVPVNTDLLWQNLHSEKSSSSFISKKRIFFLLLLIALFGGLVILNYHFPSGDYKNETTILADYNNVTECPENTSVDRNSGQNIENRNNEKINIPTSTRHTKSPLQLTNTANKQKTFRRLRKIIALTESVHNIKNTPTQIKDNPVYVSENQLLSDNTPTGGITISNLAFLPGLRLAPASESAAFGGGRGRRQPEGCPTFDRRAPFTFEIIPEIGYFKPLKTLSGNFSEPSELFDLRKNNEKSLEGLQAALYGRLNLGDLPLYLQSGLYYTRTTERMNLEYNYIRRDTTFGIISITRSPTGDTVTTIYGDIIKETRISGTSVGHHYLQTLDVPVILGYEFPFGRFVLGLEGGIFFNLFLKSTGRILDSPASFAEVSDTGNFRSALGLNYMAAANVSTQMGPGRIYLAGRFRHFPDAFSNDGALIRQEYRQAGVHLGYIFPITRTGLKVL